MTMLRKSRVLLLAACIGATSASMAAAAAGLPATVPAALAILPFPALAQAGGAGFGVILDTRRVGVDGATVLAVTPGSAAERIGLQPGDVLVSVDGRPMTGSTAPSAALRAALRESDGHLRLGIVRDGRTQTLAGTLAGPETVAAAADTRSCGYLTTQGAPPRNTQGIHPAEIVNIDGASTPVLFEPNRHRVDTGRHVLIVRERIDDHRFGALSLAERERQLRDRKSHAYKVLLVDVDPGTRYDVGARLLATLPDIASIRSNTYWEPVVWNSTPEACDRTLPERTPRHSATADGPADAVARGCGFVTTQGTLAGAGQRTFPVRITRIDGLENFSGRLNESGVGRAGLASTGGSRYHQLQAGRHAFVLRAMVEQFDMPSADKRLIRHHRDSAIGARADNTLAIDIEPGHGYWIGGRLLDVPVDQDSVRDGSWWEPVIVPMADGVACR